MHKILITPTIEKAHNYLLRKLTFFGAYFSILLNRGFRRPEILDSRVFFLFY